MKDITTMKCPTITEIKDLLKSKGIMVGGNIPSRNDLILMYDTCVEQNYFVNMYDLKVIYNYYDSTDVVNNLQDKILANYEITNVETDCVYINEIADVIGYCQNNYGGIRKVLKGFNLYESNGTNNKAKLTGIKRIFPSKKS